MKALLAALLLAFCLLCPCAHAQKDGDYRETFLRLKALAEQGNAIAQGALGSFYYTGRGVAKDYVEAVKWSRKAAEQGDAENQTSLGNAYFNGKGVDKDYVEAVKWFRMAGAQGNVLALHRLGLCYADGRGVAVNNVEAYAFFNLVSETGDVFPELRENAAELRDSMEKKMSPQQVAASQARTKELRAIVEASAKAKAK
jgi:TPR repeat protein